MKSGIQPRHREDRNDMRSKSGVPRTYLEAYEFWLNAIYSVSKTGLANGYYRAAKVIFVFSKADEVEKAEEIANYHLKTIRMHMHKKNNSFSLVHEDDGMFILSCKTDSPYFENLYKLKATIKRVSDQVAFEKPIPIKWLKLANEILREDQPILTKTRIQFLAENCHCSEKLQDFLHLFNDIGFFFYKQGKIILSIQSFLNIIYHMMFPQYFKGPKETPIDKLKDIKKCNDEGKLSLELFDYILEGLGVSNLRDSVLELLLLYGVLIRSEYEGENCNFYVPYMFKGSLIDLSQGFPKHSLVSTFFLYFPDGFLPASLYFTLLAECLKRVDNKIPKYSLGYDCAIFYVTDGLLVYFDFFTDHTTIFISFHSIDSLSSNDETYSNFYLDIMHYLKFLQLFLIQIQSTFIPCGNLAKVIFSCDSCGTLSLENPTCSLETVLSTSSDEIVSILEEVDNVQNNTTNPPFHKRFCCRKQLSQVSEYISTMGHTLEYYYKSYDNTMLAQLILSNRNKFKKHLNWRKLSKTLFSYGLLSSKGYSTIINEDVNLENISEDLLMEMVHKGPYWAIKFYRCLNTDTEDRGHLSLVRLIEEHVIACRKKGLIKSPLTDSDHSSENKISRVYKMNKNRHGIAFIVNIESFDVGLNYSKRVGSQHDVDSLIRLFESIQYDTKVYKNLTRLEYIRAQREIQSLDHSDFDSFFCVIMSHGNEKGEVIFSNNKALSKSKIVNEFSPRYCEGLKSKPKIFIFQACRGKLGKTINLKLDNMNIQQESLVDNLDSICSKDGAEHLICNPPKDSKPCKQLASPPIGADIDTFIGDSTVDQYVSYRSESGRTFFIQSFCSVMHACIDMEFTHIMMEVRRKVSLYSEMYIQCTEDTNRLQGQVYF